MHRPGERLIAAWAPEPFVRAVDELSRAAGLSRSEVVRRSLAQTALRLAGEADGRERANA